MNRVEYIVSLVQSIVGMRPEGDLRPDWLKALPGADEPYRNFLYLLATSAPYHRGGMPEAFCVLHCESLGTNGGTSALHFAAGAGRFSRVVTLCDDPVRAADVERIAGEHGFSVGNVQAVTDPRLTWDTKELFDVLFVSGDSSVSNYQRFKKNLHRGSLIVFGDLALNPAWKVATEPRLEFPALHFGVAFIA